MIPLTRIGKTIKSTGIKGWLKFWIDEIYLEILPSCAFVFLDLDGSLVPFRIQHLEMNTQLLIKFKDVDNDTEAKKLGAKDLLIEDKYIVNLPASENEYSFEDLVGFTMKDLDSEKSGEIVKIHSYPEQEIAEVIIEENSVLIPLHEDLILDFDLENKLILMDLPEGLIQLNE